MRPSPYVGVSGVISPAQQQHLTATHQALGLHRHRALLLGVKGTHKTQWLDIPNSYGTDWFPAGESTFAGALTPTLTAVPAPTAGGTVLGVAQVFLDPDLVHDPDYRDAFTAQLLMRGSRWLTGVQFDLLPWHEAAWTRDYLTGLRGRGVQVLLQAHSPAMTALGPDGAAARLAELADGLDHVLFDSSHGTGTSLDVDALAPFLHAATTHPDLTTVGFGVAGGLDADTAPHLAPLLEIFPALSWDAEGKLHPPTAEGARPVDLPAADAYLAATADLLNR